MLINAIPGSDDYLGLDDMCMNRNMSRRRIGMPERRRRFRMASGEGVVERLQIRKKSGRTGEHGPDEAGGSHGLWQP